MFSFIRYTIYLFIILVCFFILQKWGIDVNGRFQKSVDSIKSFSKSIANAPTKSDNAVITDILKQDYIGGLKGTTTVKSYSEKKTETKVVIKKDLGMSIAGVLQYTNAERVKYGLKPLVINQKLSNSAIVKVDDMFALQYFEHTSPTGKTASDLVRAQGYDFQSVGENLALGDFGTDKKLVEAWMNSPLHRKNILNPNFTEIGIAVAKGTYKGDTQWLAVQHFGKPSPVCSDVSASFKENVDIEKTSLEYEERELKKIAEEIELDPNQNKAKDFLDAYNARVANYNARLGALRDLIREYNVKVEEYNTCLAS